MAIHILTCIDSLLRENIFIHTYTLKERERERGGGGEGERERAPERDGLFTEFN